MDPAANTQWLVKGMFTAFLGQTIASILFVCQNHQSYVLYCIVNVVKRFFSGINVLVCPHPSFLPFNKALLN